MKFKQKKLSDIHIYGCSENDYGCEANITWEASIECRQYGIKSIIPIVYEVAITIENEETLESYNLDVFDYKIINNMKIDINGYLSVDEIIVDMNNKTIEIV